MIHERQVNAQPFGLGDVQYTYLPYLRHNVNGVENMFFVLISKDNVADAKYLISSLKIEAPETQEMEIYMILSLTYVLRHATVPGWAVWQPCQYTGSVMLCTCSQRTRVYPGIGARCRPVHLHVAKCRCCRVRHGPR